MKSGTAIPPLQSMPISRGRKGADTSGHGETTRLDLRHASSVAPNKFGGLLGFVRQFLLEQILDKRLQKILRQHVVNLRLQLFEQPANNRIDRWRLR